MIKALSYVNVANLFTDTLALKKLHKNFHRVYIRDVRQPVAATLVAL